MSRRLFVVRPGGRMSELQAERDQLLARLATVEAELNVAPAWKVGEPVKPADRRMYEAVVYECIQGHTTQADWTPDVTPALWMPR